MNQEQVKDKLLQIDENVPDFTITFSGKKSKKVNGLYYPERKEIIIHNKNFEYDDSLMYTAIHEFAHHIQFSRSPEANSARAHNNDFWDIFHRLLFSAEENGLYKNIFRTDERFIELTERIKNNYIGTNADLMKEFGQLLVEAMRLCEIYNISFDDYVDRELKIHRNEAKNIVKIQTMDVNPKIGFENMKTVANIKDPGVRIEAEEAFIEGKTPDMIKALYLSKPEEEDTLDKLLKEKDRIISNIEKMTVRLTEIENKIDEQWG